jgi:hypothetical protein
MTQKFSALFAICIAILFGTAALAEEHEIPGIDACPAPGYRTDVRPDSKGPPTEVIVGMRMVDLTEINDVNQTISVDLAIRMQWTDPRLADWAGCRLSKRAIWFPALFLKNSGRRFERWPQTVSVEEGGKVTYLQRVSGTFSSYHQLAAFPFDKQKITLSMFTLDWSAEKVVLKNDESFSGMTPLLNISDWQVHEVSIELPEAYVEAVDQVHSGYNFTVSTSRYLDYYIWKVILPIALIVIMSWSVFWIDPSHFGTQVGFSATSVLTMVAFIFATTSILPRLGYFTTLDKYIAGATVFVFVGLAQSLSTGYLASRQRTELAQRIDLISRVTFPVSFAIFCAAILRFPS